MRAKLHLIVINMFKDTLKRAGERNDDDMASLVHSVVLCPVILM
jgi:hypothetical protein